METRVLVLSSVIETFYPSDLNVLYCDILYYEYVHLKVGTTHFYRLALSNLVLGLTNILLKSKLFKL